MDETLHRFSHHAMDTPFEVVISGYEYNYARQAANAVFLEVDHLEQNLSKFLENSDLGRIAALQPGDSARIAPETMECLLSALWVHRETGGAFDVALGKGIDNLILDPDDLTASVKKPMALDLGGVGKGFALDVAADVISDWSIENVLLSGGASTALALGVNGDEDWSVGLYGSPITLKDKAVSGSGTDVRGEHVIDPRTGLPAEGHKKAWAICPSAAVADALSTAFMVMSTEEVEAFCMAHDDVFAHVINENGAFLSF